MIESKLFAYKLEIESRSLNCQLTTKSIRPQRLPMITLNHYRSVTESYCFNMIKLANLVVSLTYTQTYFARVFCSITIASWASESDFFPCCYFQLIKCSTSCICLLCGWNWNLLKTKKERRRKQTTSLKINGTLCVGGLKKKFQDLEERVSLFKSSRSGKWKKAIFEIATLMTCQPENPAQELRRENLTFRIALRS